MNRHDIIGNLGRDPEVRYTQAGDPVCTFSVATSERWKDKSGNRQERTEWHNVVVFGKLAGICRDYLQKGTKVFLSGKVVHEKYTDRDGNERVSTKTQLSGFDGKMEILSGGAQRDSGDAGGRHHRDGDDRPGRRTAAPPQEEPPFEPADDDVPF